MLEINKHRSVFNAKNPSTEAFYLYLLIFNASFAIKCSQIFTYISDLPDFSQDLIASDLLLDAIATAVKSMYFISTNFYSFFNHTIPRTQIQTNSKLG